MENLRTLLDHLIEKDQTITIVYHGGSQPGTKRDVVPIMVLPTKLRARDIGANETKIFLLDKLEIVASDHDAPAYEKTTKIDNRAANLTGIFEIHSQEFERLGWLAAATPESIRLFDPSKQKKRKYGVVGIRRNFETFLSITIDDATSGTEPSTDRPWFVYGPDVVPGLVEPEPEPGQSYKYLTKAVRVFLDQATRHAPKKPAGSS